MIIIRMINTRGINYFFTLAFTLQPRDSLFNFNENNSFEFLVAYENMCWILTCSGLADNVFYRSNH